MPKIDDVAYLVRMIGNKFYTQSRELIEKMAEQERKNGREQSAKKLEQALINWTDAKLIELPSNVQKLVWANEPRFSLSDLYLGKEVSGAIQSFLLDRINVEVLRDAGLTPRNRILLAGPPGNGKTSLAEALANELELPLLSIKLHETINSHMGDTSSNIGRVFEYAQFNNCLVFLDELDCLGSQRIVGATAADKERDSIVNTLLTNLDKLPYGSIIVGATNLPESIDGALERRFNLKLWMDNPSDEQIKSFIGSYQLRHGVSLPEFSNLSGKPWSRVAEFCINCHRALVLGDENVFHDDWVGRK